MPSPALLLIVSSLWIFLNIANSFSLPLIISGFRKNTRLLTSHKNTVTSARIRFHSKMAATSADGTSSTTPILVHTSPFLRPANNNNTATKTTSSETVHQALVILNSPIRTPPSPLFRELWDTSSVRVCADGGANRLYQADASLIPNLVAGDLDSLHPQVRSYYEKKGGVSIERDPCQNSNDLDKALTALLRKQQEEPPLLFTRVIVYGAFGGRFDQEMGCIQALFNWSAKFQYRMVLFDDNTSAFLLPAGVRNEIRLPHYGDNPKQDHQSQQFLGEGPTCGLIPIGCKCDTIVTTGFKWDLDGSIPMEFGGLVSTSNHVSEKVVTVEASHPLIFTAEVTSGLEDSF